MKIIALFGSLIALSAPLNAAPLVQGMHHQSNAGQHPSVMVMAHRGCWQGGAPEVSLAAIRACEAIQVRFVEVDVQKTRDGHLILMHDDSIDRMTNGIGNIAKMTLAQLRKLRLRARDGGPGAPLTNERIPTLEEGLETARGKFILHLHLKQDIAQEVVDVVKRLNMAGQVTSWVSGTSDNPTLIHSPMRDVIGMVPVISECGETITPSCRTNLMGDLLEYSAIAPTGFYMISRKALSEANARDFIRNSLEVKRPSGSWIMATTLFDVDTLPSSERRNIWKTLIDMGVHVIMTDHPADLTDLIRSYDKGD